MKEKIIQELHTLGKKKITTDLDFEVVLSKLLDIIHGIWGNHSWEEKIIQINIQISECIPRADRLNLRKKIIRNQIVRVIRFLIVNDLPPKPITSRNSFLIAVLTLNRKDDKEIRHLLAALKDTLTESQYLDLLKIGDPDLSPDEYRASIINFFEQMDKTILSKIIGSILVNPEFSG